MPQYAISAGDYPGMKHWSVAHSSNRLVIRAGRVPWGSLVLVESVVGGLTYAILGLMRRYAPEDRLLFTLMCIPVGIAVLGCFLLPVMKIRRERAKGDILAYEAGPELLALPRERLSLRKAQILEFRILQEYVEPGEPGAWTYSLLPRSRTRGNNGAAELQVIYRNPNQKSLTLLRACGGRLFEDVVTALKAAGFARIVLAEQQPDRNEWRVSEL